MAIVKDMRVTNGARVLLNDLYCVNLTQEEVTYRKSKVSDICVKIAIAYAMRMAETEDAR